MKIRAIRGKNASNVPLGHESGCPLLNMPVGPAFKGPAQVTTRLWPARWRSKDETRAVLQNTCPRRPQPRAVGFSLSTCRNPYPQAFRPPWVSPSMNWRCKLKKKISTGAIIITAAALVSDQSRLYRVVKFQ